jgi:hypothetical protein
MNDLVASAARALCAKYDGSSPDDASTRRRILAEAQAALNSRRRRRVFAAVWVPLAAVLVVSSAWAAVTGRMPRLVAWLEGTPHETMRVTGIPTGAGSASDATAATPTEAPTITATPTEAPTITATPAMKAIRSPTPVAPSSASTTRASVPASAEADVEEALYAGAHHAHFVARDPAAALRAWDDYLVAYPAGRFSLEARYNRALALVRLGRTDEARAALTPFADGRSGGYRQAEARSLLDAMDAGH